MADLTVVATVVFAYALVSRRLSTTVVSAPLVFVVAGILAGPKVLGLSDTDVTEGPGLAIAELALALVLFSDASRVDLRSLRAHEGLPGRLLGIGMPLRVGLGVAAGGADGHGVLGGTIVAAVLAPTDAALGQAVVASPAVPARIREALTVEAGLNDGLSVPFVALFLGLAVEEAHVSATRWSDLLPSRSATAS